ncbi:LysR family transcriptional regulator [Nocardia sp. NPDC004123]
MDLHQIEYFLAVVDHNGVNAAASALDLPQPTISGSIRALERDLDVLLFHRIGRGMVLTSAGHSLVGPARRILRDVVTAEGSLVDAAGRQRGRLDIATMPALAVDPVARLVGAFRREYPAVAVRITNLRHEAESSALIRDGHSEIVVSLLPIPDSDGLVVRELGEQEFWLVLPPGSDLPPADPLPLSALPDVPHVIVPKSSSQAVGEIEDAIAAAGRSIIPSVVIDHREARLPLVMAGAGATFLPRSMAEAASARGATVRAVQPKISRPFGLIFHDKALSPAGRAFLRLLDID